MQSGWFTNPTLNQIQPPKTIPTALLQANALRPPIRLKEDLQKRLKKFSYPYPEERRKKHRVTFYQKVKDAGILRDLLDLLHGQLFWAVFVTLQLNEANDIERSKRRTGLSEYGYPIGFHHEMLRELLTHALLINALINDYKVPRAWTENHLRSTDIQLARELAVSHWYWPGAKTAPRGMSSWERDIQVEIFQSISSSLKRHKFAKGAKELAIQLTSLICSPPTCVQTGELDPSPDAIRKKTSTKITKKKQP